MCSYWFMFVRVGACLFVFVLIGPDWFLFVLFGSYLPSLFLTGSCGFIDSYLSLRLFELIGFHGD